MDRRTKQILTIVICLLIAGFGIYYNVTNYMESSDSLLRMFGFF